MRARQSLVLLALTLFVVVWEILAATAVDVAVVASVRGKVAVETNCTTSPSDNRNLRTLRRNEARAAEGSHRHFTMSIIEKSTVPSWDGTPARWRKYVKEIEWFCRSTKANERQFIVGKLEADSQIDW